MDETSIKLARRLHPDDFTEADDPLMTPDDLYILPDAVMWFVLAVMCCAAFAAWMVLL